MIEAHRIEVPDGPVLEAELAVAPRDRRARALLCHPHPQYGGTMRSLVISALFEALPRLGVDCLRFNFRGVEGSTGEYDHGRGERRDVQAALDHLLASTAPAPVVVAGWSFGADMALATHDPRIAAWMGIALPMRFVDDADRAPVAQDPRPKLLALAAHDEFRAAEEVVRATAGWVDTRVEIVPGASHFFVGRTDRLIALADELVGSLTDASSEQSG